MEDKAILIEILIETATEYGKTSFELAKLKAVEKGSGIVSSVIPKAVVLLLISTFVLFLSLGISFWIGEKLDKVYYGFFAVAGFYAFIGIFLRVFMYKWLKKMVCDCFIKMLLK